MSVPVKPHPIDDLPLDIDAMPDLLVGSDTSVPTLHGPKRYINFDNAASTPTFKPIVESVTSFLRWYSNVHRGTGFKSQLSSWAFETSRDLAARFVGADLSKQVVIFTKNTTEAINRLSRRLDLNKDDVILTTLMEHHSNELPWRRVGKVYHIELNDDGTISKDHFQKLLKEHRSKLKIVAITGASNVTGYINDIDYFAREAHRAGAKILVDGAQLIPHRPVDVKADDPECGIDYLVFSAHKMYAPFGVGVIVGDRATFEKGEPATVGGGVVDIVTLEDAYWTELPDREEAGTPDIVGVVALGTAIRMFERLGWDKVIAHEAELTAYALTELGKIPKVTIYGDSNPANAAERLGVISLNVEGVSHALTAAVLGYEGAIGVRSGCFCAHLYVKSILHFPQEREHEMEQAILSRDRSDIPGTVRMSFGLYNTKAEVDEFVRMIRKIADGDYAGDYVIDKERGEYSPRGFAWNFTEYFKF